MRLEGPMRSHHHTYWREGSSLAHMRSPAGVCCVSHYMDAVRFACAQRMRGNLSRRCMSVRNGRTPHLIKPLPASYRGLFLILSSTIDCEYSWVCVRRMADRAPGGDRVRGCGKTRGLRRADHRVFSAALIAHFARADPATAMMKVSSRAPTFAAVFEKVHDRCVTKGPDCGWSHPQAASGPIGSAASPYLLLLKNPSRWRATGAAEMEAAGRQVANFPYLQCAGLLGKRPIKIGFRIQAHSGGVDSLRLLKPRDGLRPKRAF